MRYLLAAVLSLLSARAMASGATNPNALTAIALASSPTTCGANSSPIGVDAQGNALSCSVNSSTAGIAGQFVQVAASTTTLSASTAALSGQFVTVGASTAALAGRLVSVAASTASLSASTVSLAGLFVTNPSSSTNTSVQGLLINSSVTAGAFFGDGSHLAGVGGTFSGGTVANQTTFNSTVTVQGSDLLGNSLSLTGGITINPTGNQNVSIIPSDVGTGYPVILISSTSGNIVAIFGDGGASFGNNNLFIHGGGLLQSSSSATFTGSMEASSLSVQGPETASSGTYQNGVLVSSGGVTINVIGTATSAFVGGGVAIVTYNMTAATTSVSNSSVTYSTITFPGYMFNKPGQELFLTCVTTTNATAVANSSNHVYISLNNNSGTPVYLSGNSPGTSVLTVQTLSLEWIGHDSWINATTFNSVTGNIFTQPLQTFDETTPLTFNCSGYSGKSGNMDFYYMRAEWKGM